MKLGKWITRTRLAIILGILALAVLGAALALRRPAPAPITHINIPLTQYPTIPPSAPSYTILDPQRGSLAGKGHSPRSRMFPAPSRSC